MEIKDIFRLISNKLRDNDKISLCDCFSDLDSITIDDWEQYCYFSETGYQRNLVIRDEILDCYLLCWLPNQNTKFHYHPSRGCLYQILEGELTESRGKQDGEQSTTKLLESNTRYIHNNEGGHMMSNSNDMRTVSLHFYSPSRFYD